MEKIGNSKGIVCETRDDAVASFSASIDLPIMENLHPPTDPAMTPASVGAEALTVNLREAVFQLPDRALVETLTQVELPAEPILADLRKFLDLICTLRSPENWHAQQPPSAAALLPYVRDEAQDILEALAGLGCPAPAPLAESPVLTRLDDLTSRLLWCVARSAYSTMQLLEGLPARVCPPDGEWQAGILRLAVIVEIHRSPATVALDVALGCPPTAWIKPDWLIQLDQESDFQLGWAAPATDVTERSLFWFKRSLSALTQQLLTTQPALQPWLDGLPVNWLIPGGDWQSGVARLKLDIDFMPQSLDSMAVIAPSMNSIEAELVDDPDPPLPLVPAAAILSPPRLPVTVVDMSLPATLATTMIRVATPATQTQFTQFAIAQELSHFINTWRGKLPAQPLDDLLLPLVQATFNLTELSTAAASPHFCLLQPELLMDELLPKLRWRVTRSSFAGMEWLGGVACRLLKPAAAWETGLLRLMVVLEMTTQDEQWWVDLTTGRFLPELTWTTPAAAIADLPPTAHPNLVAIQQLNHELQQMMMGGLPELASLSAGIDIEWLTAEYDWQPGHLRLHMGLEFVPNLF